ncbi:helix-turn-helix domain-containing protein [Streptomyces liangshanensis]|uniref:Helix-turn-helix domain-containing protein n=1 Tax=Streptomyces liangshanensis TaxID=2717324 RepID=A0A6G9H4D8_9ACTN|nr:helix-turn-helix transcriptional regulator [Streptomyces liangshanensis]QIQ05385.1 helix-turn-helix domain-containing protein [Streptomyces liangshanensis]
MAPRPRELTPDRSARHLFGSEMRRHRELAGMSLESLATVVRYAKSSLARYETADAMIPPDLPGRLDAAFGTDGLFEKLYGLAKYEIHPDKYRRRMELEARARVIDQYAGQLVPGLVQTEDYARALFRVTNPRANSEAIEEKVAARMGRQALLAATPGPDLSVILDEAVVRRPVGGSAVMRSQLARLCALVDTPTTTVQLLPFGHGEHALLGGGTLTLMTLDDKSSVVYEEGLTSGTLVEEPEAVRTRRRDYDLMRAYALSPRDTAARIRSAMEELP